MEVNQSKPLQIFPYYHLSRNWKWSIQVHQQFISVTFHQLQWETKSRLKQANHLTNSIIFVFPFSKNFEDTCVHFFCQAHFICYNKHLNGESEWSRPKLQSLLQNSLVEETKTMRHFRDTIPVNITTLSFHEKISPEINILLSIKC